MIRPYDGPMGIFEGYGDNEGETMSNSLTFEMGKPQPKKHSVRFDYIPGSLSAGFSGDDKFNPSFYVPTAPGFTTAKRIKVTLEVIE